MARQISLDEVKKHNKNDSVWLVIHNNVYDVTAFLNEVCLMFNCIFFIINNKQN